MSRTQQRMVIMLSLGACCLAGCGLGAYEERLQKTDQRNRYFARLDEALDPYWSQPAYGLWLRPPKGMYGVPAPPRPKQGEEPPPDARQQFQGTPLDLPGIIQAWEGPMPTAGGGAGTYRLYVLGNHTRFIRSEEAGRSSDPKQFLPDLEIALQTLFGVTLPEGDRGRSDQNNAKYRVQVPQTEQFVVPKTFQAVNFVPAAEGQTPFQAWLFELTTGPVQLAVLMLTPPAPANDARQAMMASLETLQVSGQAPGVQAGGGAAGGRPAGGF